MTFMAKDKVLRYPRIDRPFSLGLELALNYPSEIEEGLERLRESLKHPDAVNQGLTEVQFLIRDFERSAKRSLKTDGKDTRISHIPYDEEFLDGVRISSAKAVIMKAHNLRDAIEKKDLDQALIQMMLMTAAAIRMEVFEDAMWGMHSELQMKKAGRHSGSIRHSEAKAEHDQITREAKELVNEGIPQHELSSRIGRKFKRSPKHVREILKKKGLYTEKRKST